MKRGWLWKVLIPALAIIVLVVALYFTLVFHYNCDNLECYKSKQAKCVKTKFIYDTPETTWLYLIEGKTKYRGTDVCEIEVTAVQVKDGNLDRLTLQEESMNCFLPIGLIALPESDLSRCHGILKEKSQELIIGRLHIYIVENIGEVSEGLGEI